MKKLIAILVALAMAAMLSITAFAAEDEPTSEPATTTLSEDQTNANPKLVKYLHAPSGVTVPTEVFHFTFTAVSVPQGSTLTTFTETIGISTNDMLPSADDDDAGAMVSNIDIEDIFDGKLDKPGVYTFTVGEVDNETADFTYDSTQYTLKLYVKGTGDSTTIDSATVQLGNNEKEDTTIVDPSEEDEDVQPGDAGNGFTFVNSYTNSDPRTEANAALKVTKAVNDYVDSSYPFSFTITLGQTDTRYDADIPATITRANGDTESVTLNLRGNTNITLAADEKLVVLELPAGTTYVVKENLTSAQLQNQTGITADATITGIAATETWENDPALTVATPGKNLIVTSTGGIVDDNQAANLVAVTNTAEEPEPEGILISNLPYIALALVAIGGLVAYVVVRRKADDEA